MLARARSPYWFLAPSSARTISAGLAAMQLMPSKVESFASNVLNWVLPCFSL
jgi:hypothetical protein